MSGAVRALMSLALVLVPMVTLVRGAGAEPVVPDRVRALCGDPPYAAEDLCNVDGGLRDAFLLIEEIVEDPALADGAFAISPRVVGVVREHHVAVEWYPSAEPDSLRSGLAGMYRPSERRVLLAPVLRDEPPRVRAAVLAHELGHAAWDVDGLGQEPRPREACLVSEARAYRIGLATYERARRVTAETDPPPAGSFDRFLADDLALWRELSGGEPLTDGALNDLANRHIFGHGYDESCSWR